MSSACYTSDGGEAKSSAAAAKRAKKKKSKSCSNAPPLSPIDEASVSTVAADLAEVALEEDGEEREAPVRPAEHVSLAEVGDVTAALADAVGGEGAATRESTPPPESTVGGQSTCIVCFESDKSHLAAPCGHQCVCGPCSSKMEKCPYCCAPVAMWVNVHAV